MITEYAVTGMTCEHCERSVGEEVGALPGVTAVHAVAATGVVRVTSDSPLADDDVAAAIDEAGYELVRG
ncbi:heavy metal-associated domain-containing protein [Amnibacterium soli]|uniref:Heavy metal-associated domain-containing protein n=1 Tax=Amnibacterium soli TaxID=1282736 RepID=A0ABP8ZBB6_9MICO